MATDTPHYGGTVALSWGRSGGFYVMRRGNWWRICLWRVALTKIDVDLDYILVAAAEDKR